MITGFKKWIDYILFAKKTKLHYNQELLSSISRMLDQAKQRQNPALPLKEATFVVFDTETTGFYPYAGDQLLSIGAVMIQNGRVDHSQRFHEWIRPDRPIPDAVRRLTQVKDEELLHAPSALEVIHQFLQFIGPHVLVAHCADFDLNFINLQLKKYCKQKLRNPVIDTMGLSFHLHPSHPSHSLDALLGQYGIPVTRRHHALEDAVMTANLFIKLMEVLERRGVTTLQGLDHYLRSRQTLHHSPSL